MHQELEEVQPNSLWGDIKHVILKEVRDNVSKKQITKKSPWLYPVQQSILHEIGGKPKLLKTQSHIRSSMQSFKSKQKGTKKLI